MSTAGSGGGGRRVTIRSISCRGVKAFVPFQKPPLYAAVSLAGRREKTSGDPDGGENPDWDAAVFAFDLPAAGDGMLQFEVKAQVPLLGSKLVGKVSVPLADLAVAGGDGAAAAPRHVSYQYIAGYPPPPPSNFYPPPPAGYPAPSFPSPTSTYPPPPPPESASSQYPPPLPRSAPCCDRSVDRALPSYMSPRPPPPGVPCYPPPAAWLPDQEAAGAPYSLYPQPGTRYL
uniref:C2 domain-containing protein n=1 Tax=Oryza barthii TaxID=65489 RepID=A0A0D3HMN1_9ORYZ